MTAFDTAWALFKMPFVPGSVREGELEEGDENWEDRQNYLADFHDPVDDRTRQMNIQPTWKRKPKPDERRVSLGSIFGGGSSPEGTVVNMPLDEDELRDPELLFGQEQQIPFSYFYRNANLDRMFTPTNQRRRGIGTGMVDAMQEYREKILGIPSRDEADAGGWGQITDDSDDAQTEDMFRFWHKRGYMPSFAYPKNPNQMVGEDQYYASNYGRLYDNSERPRWDRQGPNTEPFDVGWGRAKRFGQYQLGADQERSELQMQCDKKSEEIAQRFGHHLPDYDPDGDVYEMAYQLNNKGIIGDDDLHADGNYTCSCWAGHPWYETEGENMELHESKKGLFPNTWAYRNLFDEEGGWVGE